MSQGLRGAEGVGGLVTLQQDEFAPEPRHDMDSFRKGPFFFKCLAPRKFITFLVGKYGQTIDEVEEATGIKIIISEPGVTFFNTNDRIMMCSGDEDAMDAFLTGTRKLDNGDTVPVMPNFIDIVADLAERGYKDVLRQPDSFVMNKTEDPDCVIKVIVPRNSSKAILGEDCDEIESDGCTVSLLDPDPADEETTDVLLVTSGKCDMLGECLFDIAAILAEDVNVHSREFITVDKEQVENCLNPGYYSSSLFGEVFQQTSAGDFGVELLPNGPLFRCHSVALQGAFPGFLECIRKRGKTLPLSGAPPELSILEALHEVSPKKAKERLLADAQFAAFSTDGNLHGIDAQKRELDLRQMDNCDLETCIGPTIGAIRRRDPFQLAERYAVDEKLEHMVELMRFMYQGKISYFNKDYIDNITPEMKKEMWSHVREMLFMSEKYAVDRLFRRCLEWFAQKCLIQCGDKALVNAFYQLNSHVERTKEPMFRHLLRTTVIDLMTNRTQLRLISTDPRWSTLQIAILHEILTHPKLAISSELEILQFIKRWDAQTDKPKDEVKWLLTAFRPDFPGGLIALERVCTSYGFDLEGRYGVLVPENRFDPKRFAKLPKFMMAKEAKRIKPRCNTAKKTYGATETDDAEVLLALALGSEQGSDLGTTTQTSAAAAAELEKMKEAQNEETSNGFCLIDTFTCETYDTGFAFKTTKGFSLLQSLPFTQTGNYRVRVTLSQMQAKNKVWVPHQKVFVGATFGDMSFFGFNISQTAFAGIYEAQFAAHRPVDPDQQIDAVNLTGSAGTLEFDMQIDINPPTTDTNMWCHCVVLMNTQAKALQKYPIRKDLFDKHGLRFRVIPTGITEKESLDVSLSWVTT